MTEIGPTIPYAWVKYARNAISATMIALNEATKRMDVTNPLDDTEEMAYLRKTREALQKALKETAFIESIPY